MATPTRPKIQVEEASSKASTVLNEDMNLSPDLYVYNEEKQRADWEKMDSDYRKRWDTRMEASGYMTASSYLKVAVLMISWHDDSDDLKVADEVERLQNVFVDKYRYKVKPILLRYRKDKLVQVQVNKALANFVEEEDGPNTLLIVYYAGHGVPADQDHCIKLSGKHNPEQEPDLSFGIEWRHAESNLHHTLADVLQIFDCCYAGNLGRSTTFNSRSWEYLAATSYNELAELPGETSFTSALIWALESLVNEGKFTTSDLVQKIRVAPKFKKSQVPTLRPRNERRIERIVLGPVPSETELKALENRNEEAKGTASQQLLDLRFVFKERPSPQDTDRFADALSMAIKNHSFKVTRVIWGGLHHWVDGESSSNVNHLVYLAAQKLKQAGRRGRRRSMSRQRPSLDQATGQTSPASLSDSPLDRPSKRQRTSPPSE